MMNILITGSEGFVGNVIIEHPYLKKHNIYCLDKIPSSRENFIQYDLSEDNIEDFRSKCPLSCFHLIIHLAAAKGDFMLSDKDFYRDNVLATKTLIKIANAYNVEKIIHYSTVSVYGHNNNRKDEKALLKPNNVYGKTKLESEELLIKWLKNGINRNLTILRPSVIYGIGNYANMYNLLSNLNQSFPIAIGDGNYVKSMIAVENIVDITMFCLDRMNGLQVYNCTDEPYPTLKQTMEFICVIDGFKMPMVKIPVWLAAILAVPFELLGILTKRDFKITRDRVYKYSTETDYRSDLIRLKGYKQKFSTEERLHNMAKWYLSLKRSEE